MKLVTAYLLVVLAIIVVVWACVNVVERQQTISAANQKFEQMIESAKELPPDSCGRYHIQQVLPPHDSDQEPVFVDSVRESPMIVRIKVSTSSEEVFSWLAAEARSCGADHMTLLNAQ